MSIPQHRKLIGLASAVRLFISVARKMATGRRWGTVTTVFQEGQIVSMTCQESWVTDDQVIQAAGPMPEVEPIERHLKAVGV